MTTISHMYDRFQIAQTSEDSIIAGREIPKGYVNATQMCKANGKLFGTYWKTQKAQSFAKALCDSVMPNGITEVVIIIQGGDADLQGTWIHPSLAIHLSIWISDEFALWSAETLQRVINGEFLALTEEAATAQTKLKDLNESIWAESRKLGKMTRRTLTDAIKDYLLRHDGRLSENYRRWVYANATDAMYGAVFGMTAIELETLLNCDRNRSRDRLSAKSLQVIDRVEAAICQLIDVQDVEPCDAVARYVEFFRLSATAPEARDHA